VSGAGNGQTARFSYPKGVTLSWSWDCGGAAAPDLTITSEQSATTAGLIAYEEQSGKGENSATLAFPEQNVYLLIKTSPATCTWRVRVSS
jgi:hypothetical protein